ncbi:EI24 domain-containing protein [Bdellovibrio sp. SKB1291214]|uniref:EI24 domain-containing protein n=1 Tax=Bdellovibrio sp. SKB1291214 TaxID=1732569 RepID=UPI000B51D2FF|nr:EI24 domain-containing protein [Bdellovibrio sp. SKB1291214]UYL08322.1 EI24 domain-containing protein [Bdellovibrio sp. SKB1291214]
MHKIIKTFRQSFESLFSSRLLLLTFLPPILAVVAVFAVFFFFWGSWTMALDGFLQGLWPFQWLHDFKGAEGYFDAIAAVLLVLLFVPACFLFALILVSIFVLPLALKWIAEKDFPHLEKKRGGSLIGSLWNTLYATALFIFWFTVTLPLWLVPMGPMLVPLTLTSWLNKRVFLYDVLQDYASEEERQLIEKNEANPLFGMGMILGFFSYIPFALFFIPVFAAICYTYYGLNSLTVLRSKKS